MATAQTLMTAEELWQMPKDGFRSELVKGELVRMSPAGWKHGYVAGVFQSLLFQHVKVNDLGVVCTAEAGFILTRDPDTIRAPDVAFVAKERIPTEGIPDEYCPFAPDLAVVVVSPNDRFEDVLDKVKEYLDAGTRMVWVAVPKTESVMVFRPGREALMLGGEDELGGEDVVPGFSCRVKELFS
jgi:Uma2 family endonuclease